MITYLQRFIFDEPTAKVVPLKYKTTNDPELFNQMPSLKELLTDYGYDVPLIPWKSPDVRLIVPVNSVHITDHGMGGGILLAPTDHQLLDDASYRMFSDPNICRYGILDVTNYVDKTFPTHHCSHTPSILKVGVNLYGFYDDVLPACMKTSPRAHPEYVAALLWNALIMGNAQK